MISVETAMMVEGLLARAQIAVMETLNESAERILEKSQETVPKGDVGTHEARAASSANYPERTLEESGEVVYAIQDDLHAQVIYDSPYAAPQEAGEMVYVRDGKEIRWVAEHYTTPGTGSHYLSNAFKSEMGGIEADLTMNSRRAFQG